MLKAMKVHELFLAQTITHLEGISYDPIQIISKWPLYTSDKCTCITLYTSISH